MRLLRLKGVAISRALERDGSSPPHRTTAASSCRDLRGRGQRRGSDRIRAFDRGLGTGHRRPHHTAPPDRRAKRALCRNFPDGASRDRTGDLLLAKQALSPAELWPLALDLNVGRQRVTAPRRASSSPHHRHDRAAQAPDEEQQVGRPARDARFHGGKEARNPVTPGSCFRTLISVAKHARWASPNRPLAASMARTPVKQTQTP